eukprot:6480759-Amphidinium_carterae.1
MCSVLVTSVPHLLQRVKCDEHRIRLKLPVEREWFAELWRRHGSYDLDKAQPLRAVEQDFHANCLHIDGMMRLRAGTAYGGPLHKDWCNEERVLHEYMLSPLDAFSSVVADRVAFGESWVHPLIGAHVGLDGFWLGKPGLLQQQAYTLDRPRIVKTSRSARLCLLLERRAFSLQTYSLKQTSPTVSKETSHGKQINLIRYIVFEDTTFGLERTWFEACLGI